MWSVKHKSGTVLFVTSCERTASNRREMGWIVEQRKCRVTIEWLNGKKSTFFADGCAEMDNSIMLSVNGTDLHIPWQNMIDGEIKYFDEGEK